MVLVSCEGSDLENSLVKVERWSGDHLLRIRPVQDKHATVYGMVKYSPMGCMHVDILIQTIPIWKSQELNLKIGTR